MDDILVHKVADDHYFLCVNASNQEKDFEHIRALNRFDARVDFSSDRYAQLAIQGPKARATAAETDARVDLAAIRYYWFTDGEVCGAPARIARTGYTGEDGFEIYTAPADAARIWNEILQAGAEFGIKPCGLGARNTLRLEASMALYGHEIDASISPLEAGLDWIVKLDKGEFVGREALLRQKERASTRKLAGFEMRGRGIGRDGYEVLVERRAGRLGHQRLALAHLEQEHRSLLPARRIGAAGQSHPDHDPQPARGCGDGGNSVLQTSEMKMYPENFRYTKEHEWVLVEGDTGTIGITDHAQQ